MKKILCLLFVCLMVFSVLAFAEEEGEKSKTDIWDSIGSGLDKVGSSVGEALDSAKDAASDALDSAKNVASDALDTAKDAASDAWNSTTGYIDSLIHGSDDDVEETMPAEGQEETVREPLPTPDPNTTKYYIDEVVNTGVDNGYSGMKAIDIGDPHFGWKLGRFYVSGFTRVYEDEEKNSVFLKTLGDKVELHFLLEQDIDALNGNNKLVISEDSNGYDKYFGIPKTDFKRGALIVRHTTYENYEQTPTLYTDFLAADATAFADTTVELFEEGDYEVALDYEIQNKDGVMGINLNVFTNYRIYFKFSVRNGNCMVYPFDVATGAELTNAACTENGFYLDLARSRYLDINITRQTLASGKDGLVEDTRFNRPAKDGDEYTDDGIYIITVANRYTGQTTTKQIYVGSEGILKAYVKTGLSLDEITEMLNNGATITEDGDIIEP